MKKILLLLITFYFLEAKAQNNFQWADSGAVWHHTYNWIGMPGYQKTIYTGDTIINNINCQSLVSVGQQAWPQPNGNPIVGGLQTTNICYLYKSNDSVFTYRNNNFYLAFKTNATLGEIWDLGEFTYFTGVTANAYVKVTNVAIQNYSGVPLRDITVQACKANGDSIEWMSADTCLVSYQSIINEKFGPKGSFTTINNITVNNIIDETMPQYLLCYESATFPFIQFSASDCFNNLFVGVEEQIKNNFQVFPNPAQDQITINSKAGEKMLIADVMGKIVLEKQLKQDTETIEIDQLIQGIYILKIGVNSQKLIKY